MTPGATTCSQCMPRYTVSSWQTCVACASSDNARLTWALTVTVYTIVIVVVVWSLHSHILGVLGEFGART